MKSYRGFSKIGLIVGIVALVFLGVMTYLIIDGNSKTTDFAKYDYYSIIQPTKDNGFIGDHVKGSAEAPVLIFEYADYQCPGCAGINPVINTVIEKLDGKVALVYRNYLLSYHANATAAASAVEAAGLQGYWKEYSTRMFAGQDDWYYASASERTTIFDNYFTEVTESKGDMDKFHEDIASENVAKKISFDMGIGKRVDVQGTPALFAYGQWIKWNEAGSITINGQEITWEESLGSEEGITWLFGRIYDAMMGIPSLEEAPKKAETK